MTPPAASARPAPAGWIAILPSSSGSRRRSGAVFCRAVRSSRCGLRSLIRRRGICSGVANVESPLPDTLPASTARHAESLTFRLLFGAGSRKLREQTHAVLFGRRRMWMKHSHPKPSGFEWLAQARRCREWRRNQHSKSGGFFRAKNLQNMRIRSRGGIASGFRDDARMSRRLPANQAEYRNRSLAAGYFVRLVREMEG